MSASVSNQSEVAFAITRVFTKDVSFESPNSPAIFLEEWKPNIQMQVDVSSKTLSENDVELVLGVSVTVKNADMVAFVCEVQQAGVFHIVGLDEQQKAHALNVNGCEILFPYLRETVSNLVTKATFPQLNLEPVNFSHMFETYIKQKLQDSDGEVAADLKGFAGSEGISETSEPVKH